MGLGALFLATILYSFGHALLGITGLETMGYLILAVILAGLPEVWWGAGPGELVLKIPERVFAGEETTLRWQLEKLGTAGWMGATLIIQETRRAKKELVQVLPGRDEERREGKLGSWIFPQRGRQRGVNVQLAWTDPFRLVVRTHQHPLTDSLLVYPRRVIVRAQASPSSGLGLPFSRESGEPVNREGSSLDFLGIREYATGDPVKRVHQRTSERKGSWMVSQFHHLEGVGAWIVLPVEGWGRAQRWEDAISVAAGWASYWAENGSPTGLYVEGSPPTLVPPGEGGEFLNRILGVLATLPSSPPQKGGGTFPDRRRGKMLWILPSKRHLPSGDVGILVPPSPLPPSSHSVIWSCQGSFWEVVS